MTDSFKARRHSKSVPGLIRYGAWPPCPPKKWRALPYSLKILLENLVRFEDGVNVTRADIEALLDWDPKAVPDYEISFTPSRVIMQDFTGVPCIVDLAAMRDAIVKLGGKAERVNPLAPAELVIDHSVQVDEYGTAKSLAENNRIEFERNGERYAFLRWGQTAFDNFKVVPPNTGIVHQVNLEHLARVVFADEKDGVVRAYPDTLVGTDSHTTMINGLGVLGWGVGGIEAEAAMLGQPITMLIPQVIGFRLNGSLQPGATATDLVLTVTEMLRKKGVVDKFVEFFGDGLANLPLADRATIANMAPEFGSTCGIFPDRRGDDALSRALGTRRGADCARRGLCERAGHVARERPADAAIHRRGRARSGHRRAEPCRAASRPQDRVPLATAKTVYRAAAKKMSEERTQKNPAATGKASVRSAGG